MLTATDVLYHTVSVAIMLTATDVLYHTVSVAIMLTATDVLYHTVSVAIMLTATDVFVYILTTYLMSYWPLLMSFCDIDVLYATNVVVLLTQCVTVSCH